MSLEVKEREGEVQASAVLDGVSGEVADAGRTVKSAAELSRGARKRGLKRAPVVAITVLVLALGAGSAIGGPTLYDKFIVPALYDAVPLEVESSISASSAPAYKETVGITDLAKLDELSSIDTDTLAKRDDGFCENLINVVRPGHEKGVVLDGVVMDADSANPITTWGASEQSYSGVYLYVGTEEGEGMLSGAPKNIEVYADGQLVGGATLNEPKEATYQRVEFSRPVDAQKLSIKVLDVYPGDLDIDLEEFQGATFDLAQVTPY